MLLGLFSFCVISNFVMSCHQKISRDCCCATFLQRKAAKAAICNTHVSKLTPIFMSSNTSSSMA